MNRRDIAYIANILLSLTRRSLTNLKFLSLNKAINRAGEPINRVITRRMMAIGKQTGASVTYNPNPNVTTIVDAANRNITVAK